MKKRIYRRMPVNDFQPQSISPSDLGERLVFAIDVAKVDMVAAFAASRRPDPAHHLLESSAGERRRAWPSFARIVPPVSPSKSPWSRPAPTATCFAGSSRQDGFPVFMVSGKRTHDASEIFDGVPSLHDAKSAAIIARLHADGLSTRLVPEPSERRQLRAALAIMDLHQERYLQLVHRLESWSRLSRRRRTDAQARQGPVSRRSRRHLRQPQTLRHSSLGLARIVRISLARKEPQPNNPILERARFPTGDLLLKHISALCKSAVSPVAP